jgi:2-methylcitrate dehydratase
VLDPVSNDRLHREQRLLARLSRSPERSIANQLQIFFKDGTRTRKVTVEYPLGHRRRRHEGIPLLEEKFRRNLARRFPKERREAILELCRDQKRVEATPVNGFVDMFVI